MLTTLGHDVSIGSTPPKVSAKESYELIIALNAAKSLPAYRRFSKQHPQALLVVAITGTDIHGSPKNFEQALQLLSYAQRIICINPLSKKRLPKAMQKRSSIILQSSAFRPVAPEQRIKNRFLLVGHLRDEKDPFLAVEALMRLKGSIPIEVYHFGAALSKDYQLQAEDYVKRVPGYHWFSEVSTERIEQEVSQAFAMLLTSQIEGAPAVLSEAIASGLVVLASDIDGCRGVLGESYPGYFPAGDANALATLLKRICNDSDWYHTLQEAIAERQALFTPERERAALKSLIDEIEQSADIPLTIKTTA